MSPTIFDPLFASIPRAEMYQSWAQPDCVPGQPQARLENWSAEELEAFCGIYATGS